MADSWSTTFCGVLMDDTPDADGVRWAVASTEGWDAAPLRSTYDDNTGRHGGFGSARLWSGRLVTLLGRAHCPDMAAAFRVREKITADMPGLGPGELIKHESVPKALTVVLNDQPRTSTPIDVYPYRVTFQIPLIAHDPFKRALTARTTAVGAGSSVPLTNDGTAAAHMLVTLTSGGTVVLTAGGVTLTTDALPAGAVIDTASTSVTADDGMDLMSLVAMPPLMPLLPKGGGPVTQAGTASLSIETFDTYA